MSAERPNAPPEENMGRRRVWTAAAASYLEKSGTYYFPPPACSHHHRVSFSVFEKKEERYSKQTHISIVMLLCTQNCAASCELHHLHAHSSHTLACTINNPASSVASKPCNNRIQISFCMVSKFWNVLAHSLLFAYFVLLPNFVHYMPLSSMEDDKG